MAAWTFLSLHHFDSARGSSSNDSRGKAKHIRQSKSVASQMELTILESSDALAVYTIGDFTFSFSRKTREICVSLYYEERGYKNPTLTRHPNTTHSHNTRYSSQNTYTPKLAAKRPTQTQSTNLLGDGLTRGKDHELLPWSTTGAPPQPLLKP